MTEVDELAHEIATEACQTEIESFCSWEGNSRHDCWWDISSPEVGTSEKGWVDRAVRYLDLMGKLERCAGNPNLVQFKAVLDS